jgi:hypothetical protein
MAITNGYLTLAEATSWLRISDSVDDTIIEGLVEAASRMIDQYCGWHFYQESTATAREFIAPNGMFCPVDPISTTSGLIVKTDDDDDGTFERTWTTAEYQLEPLNFLAKGYAVWYLRVTGRGSGPIWPQSLANALVQVTARWGWPSVPPQVTQACRLQVARLNMRRQAPGGVLIAPDLGVAERLYAAIDPDAKVLLDPFRRMDDL